MLIIYAHPNKDGHSGAILAEFERIFRERGLDYELLDLYEMDYNPVLKPSEHYTSGRRDVDEINQKIQEKFVIHDRFVFIYPTWWNNLPAILKGFLDRVFVAKFAFEFKLALPVKLLKGKAVAITTTGGPKVYSIFIERSRSLKVLTKNTLEFCGIKTKGFLIGNANKLTDKQRAKIRKTVKRAFDYLK